jgi:homoserine O-acetyltransferase/O-succinyltransferase
MIDNRYTSEESHGPYKFFDLGDFSFEDGGMIPNCKIAYPSFMTKLTRSVAMETED